MRQFGLSNKGNYRSENQDAFTILTVGSGTLAVVCDGMGGAAAGKVASTMACERFARAFRIRMESGDSDVREISHQAVDAANREVFEAACQEPDYMGMGTTLVAGFFTDNKAWFTNVGDSRAYCISLEGIRQITRDHSLVQEMVDHGEITPAQARTHPRRNIITRAVGTQFFVRDELFEVDMRPNDIFLLCSDGLINAVPEAEIHRLVMAADNIVQACKTLVDAALANEARDNVTAVLIAAEEVIPTNDDLEGGGQA